MHRAARLCLITPLVLACAAPAERSGTAPPAVEPAEPAELAEPAEPMAVGEGPTFLRQNIEFDDGTSGYMHVTEDDMPLVVAIGYPRRSPKYGGRKDARRVSIESMHMWQLAIQPHLPWFRIEFVEEDPQAAVQVEWKRKITGPWGGFGGMRWGYRDGVLWVGGAMEVSTTPNNFYTLEVDEVRDLIAHEFGHVLGLGHCLECESAMNYADAAESKDGVKIHPIDVRTFLELVEQPLALPREMRDLPPDPR